MREPFFASIRHWLRLRLVSFPYPRSLEKAPRRFMRSFPNTICVSMMIEETSESVTEDRMKSEHRIVLPMTSIRKMIMP